MRSEPAKGDDGLVLPKESVSQPESLQTPEGTIRPGRMDPEAILSRIDSPSKGLSPVLHYVFQTPGKYLRSRILCLCARLVNEPVVNLTEAGILVECLHTGSLLHDDVMDRAHVRRNKPTVNRLWGDPVAILAGDYLLAAVMELALKIRHPLIPSLAVESLMLLVEGQMCEIRNQGNLELRAEQYMEIIRKKTAVLFAAACKMGGLLAQGSTKQVSSLGSFGLHFGLAFQLLDDLQDYTALQEETGKEPGRDLAEGKVTLPVLAAFQRADAETRQRFRTLFSARHRAPHLGELRTLIHDLGGFSSTREKARKHVAKAVSSLAHFHSSKSRVELEQITRSIVDQLDPCKPLHPRRGH